MKNFTSDWKDGTTVAALVDALAPGLCSEYAIMNPDAALENASHAMKLADDWLGIPQVSKCCVCMYVCHYNCAQLIPARASEQGKVIGLVYIYIIYVCVCVCVCVCVYTKKM